MTKHNDKGEQKDLGKRGVAIGEPHPPTAPKDGETGHEREGVDPTELDEAVEAVEQAVAEPFEAETRTIGEQLADHQAVAFGTPVEAPEEDDNGEE